MEHKTPYPTEEELEDISEDIRDVQEELYHMRKERPTHYGESCLM